MKFCCNCAAPVVKRVPPGDNLPRWVCDQCGEIHYQNPSMVVGTIPEHEAGCCSAAARSSRATATGRCPRASWRTARPRRRPRCARRWRKPAPQVELGAPFSMISVPYVNQVHLFYRARLRDLDFKPGEETLEVALCDEAADPVEGHRVPHRGG